MEEKHKKVPFAFYSSLNENMVHFCRVYSGMRWLAYLFLHFDFVLQCYSLT